MPKKQVVAPKKGKASVFSTDHITRPAVPDPVQTKLIHVGMKVRKSVSEGYKVKQTIFPTETQPLDTTAPSSSPNDPKKSALKRSRSENDAEEEYTSMPTLVVSASFNSYTTEEGDWDEPEWLLPKEVVCADVEMSGTQ